MTIQLTVYTEPYTEYVLKRLVGIKGKSKSDVANYILKVWIEEHGDYLESCEISVKKAINEKTVFKAIE